MTYNDPNSTNVHRLHHNGREVVRYVQYLCPVKVFEFQNYNTLVNVVIFTIVNYSESIVLVSCCSFEEFVCIIWRAFPL